MWNMLIRFLIIAALAAGAVWLAERPGTLTLDWLGYRIEIPIMAALVTLLGEQETSRVVYAAVEREFQRCVAIFEREADVRRIPDFDADARVFRMYSARIQRREGYARAEHDGGGDRRR